MRYLYFIERHGSNVYRRRVTRETDSNIWVETRNNSETKISKKTYFTGDRFFGTFYYEETADLLNRYISCQQLRFFREKLKELEKCTDEKIMKQIIAIKLPEENK